MLMFFGKGPQRNVASAQSLATLQTVRGYWEALRVAGAIPRRDQIDPRGLADCLDKVFLIEQIAAGQARFRLAGMALNDLMGMDMRGVPLTGLFEPAARARITQDLEQVFAAPAIMEIWLEAERSVGRPALSGRMLLLPVAGSTGEPGLALGCIATDGMIGRQPRRFAISALVRELLPAPALQLVPEPEPLRQTPPSRPTGRPNLRLVSSRD